MIRRFLSLIFGWVFVACLVVALVSVAIGEPAEAMAPGLLAILALTACGFFGPRSPPSEVGSVPNDHSTAAAKAEAKKAAERRRRIRREEDDIAEWQRRNNEGH